MPVQKMQREEIIKTMNSFRVGDLVSVHYHRKDNPNVVRCGESGEWAGWRKPDEVFLLKGPYMFEGLTRQEFLDVASGKTTMKELGPRTVPFSTNEVYAVYLIEKSILSKR